MSKSLLARAVSSLLAICFVFATTLTPSPTLAANQNGSGAQISKIGTKAFEDLATCLASYKKPVLDVFYLVDNSGSLSYTDPKYVRSDVLGSSISELKSFKAEGVEVNYAASLFASDLEQVQGWTSLKDDGDFKDASQRLTERIDENYGGYTDWEQGLVFANRQLESKPANHCKMLIWFTDGGINPTGELEDALDSIKNLCNARISSTSLGNAQGPFGIFADMRQNGISIFGVLYQNDSSTLKEYKKDNSDADANDLLESEHNRMEFMAPLVEGVGEISTKDPLGVFPGPGRVQCGPLDESGYSPVGIPNGAFVRAQDPVDLAFQFLNMQAVLSGGSGKQIVDGKFNVPAGTAAFKILTRGSDWKLEGPDGTDIAVDPKSSDASLPVKITNTAGVQQIQFDVLGKSDLQGTWKFNAGKSQSALYLYSGLTIELDRDQTSQIVGDRDNSLTGKIVRRDEYAAMPVDLSIYEKRDLQLNYVDKNGQLAILPGASVTLDNDGQFKAEGIRPDAAAKQLDLWISLDLGSDFNPVTASFAVVVVPRSDIASAKSNIIKLSTLDGPSGEATGVIEVVGPTAQPESEFCLDDPAVRTDDNQKAAQKHPRDKGFKWSFDGKPTNGSPYCVTVKNGEIKEIAVAVTNKTQADAKVVSIRNTNSRSAGATLSESVQFEFETKAKVDSSVAFWVDLILLILGILLPLGLLYLMNWLTTKFLPADNAVRAEYQVNVLTNEAGKLVALDGNPIVVEAQDFQYLPKIGSARSLEMGGHGKAEAKMAKFPLLPSWFQHTAPVGYRVVSQYAEGVKNLTHFADGRATEISPNHASNWFLKIADSEFAKPAGENLLGTLVVSAAMAGLPQYQARVAELSRKPGLQERIAAIRASMAKEESGPPKKGAGRTKYSKASITDEAGTLATPRTPQLNVQGIPGISQSSTNASTAGADFNSLPSVNHAAPNMNIPGVSGSIPGTTSPN